MSGADALAARLRGGFVGSSAASTTFAAHGLAGGAVPGGACFALLVLASAVVGVVAGAPTRGRVITLMVLLVAGQTFGHLLLLAVGHHHGPAVTGSMLAAHGLTAFASAVLVIVAEHLCRSVASAGEWLVLLLSGIADGPESRTAAPVCHRFDSALRGRLTGAVGTRGPPLLSYR